MKLAQIIPLPYVAEAIGPGHFAGGGMAGIAGRPERWIEHKNPLFVKKRTFREMPVS